MPGPHNPDHARSGGLALRDEAEETGNPTSAKEDRTVNGSQTRTRFWLLIVILLLGLATLAIALIFFSTWPGALTAEGIGAGLALLAVCGLVLAGARRPARAGKSEEIQASTAILDQPAEPPASSAPASPSAAPEIPGQTASAASPAEPAPTDPAVLERSSEAAASGTTQLEASALSAPSIETPAALPAAPEPAPAPAAEPMPSPKKVQPQTGQRPQNGHTPTTQAPRPRSKPKARNDAPLPFPSLASLPERLPLPLRSQELDTEAEDLSQLLGDVAEQTVLAVATRGQRGIERRARMASKIEVFLQEMAVDPNYAPVAAFLEAIVALLRAGKPIPTSTMLVDPFDGLYNYVLTLIRRKTGKTHD
jgi:hypothetical protein